MSSETWKLEKDLCRCCHAEGSFTSLAEPSQDLPQVEIVSEILRRCFDIVIRPVEGTYYTSTYTICEPCILQLRDASYFKLQVLRCEERFRDMCRNVKALGDINTEEVEESTIQFEFKEEYVEMSDDNDAVAAADAHDEFKEEYVDDNDAVAADDAHDDAPHTQQPRLETSDDETDQVPQKEMIGPEEITSSVDLNKNTSTDIKTREVNSKGTTNKRDNLLKHNHAPKKLQNIFICNDCGKRFGNKRTLAVHIGSHEKLKQGNNDLIGKECAYQTQESLDQLSKLHDKNRCFICDTCGYTTKKKYRLLNHFKLKNVHSDTPQTSNINEYGTNEIINLKKPSQNVCSDCGHKFKFRSDLIEHLRIHSSEKPYPCSFCDYKSDRKSNLKAHLRIHTGEKPYSCSFCEYKCAGKRGLKLHLLIHTGEKPYSCSFCEYKFARKPDLTRHLRIHSGNKPYSCSFCEYKSNQKNHLKNHLLNHTGEKPYYCSFCESNFVRKPDLTRHLRIHSGKKPYSCSFCEYKSTRKCHLKIHLLKHTGEKPYSCSFCDYKCTRNGDLKIHLRIHSGKLPYSCSLCEYKSNRKNHLKNHLLNHTGEKPYSCSVCEHKFTRKSALTSHLLIHSDDKPYSCSLCEYKSTRKFHLKRHLLKHTRDKPFKCARKGDLKVPLRIHSSEKPY